MANDDSLDDVQTEQRATPTVGATGEGGEEDSPWGSLVFGVLMILGAGWIYWYFGKLETEGGEVRMPAIAWALYEMVGRTGLAAIAGLIGVFATWAGISDLRKRSE